MKYFLPLTGITKISRVPGWEPLPNARTWHRSSLQQQNLITCSWSVTEEVGRFHLARSKYVQIYSQYNYCYNSFLVKWRWLLYEVQAILKLMACQSALGSSPFGADEQILKSQVWQLHLSRHEMSCSTRGLISCLRYQMRICSNPKRNEVFPHEVKTAEGWS
jgi:hypothetical protein